MHKNNRRVDTGRSRGGRGGGGGRRGRRRRRLQVQNDPENQ